MAVLRQSNLVLSTIYECSYIVLTDVTCVANVLSTKRQCMAVVSSNR